MKYRWFKKTDEKKYEWSNKDHKYSLKREDWQRLCTSCHIKYDKQLRKNLLIKSIELKLK